MELLLEVDDRCLELLSRFVGLRLEIPATGLMVPGFLSCGFQRLLEPVHVFFQNAALLGFRGEVAGMPNLFLVKRPLCLFQGFRFSGQRCAQVDDGRLV